MLTIAKKIHQLTEILNIRIFTNGLYAFLTPGISEFYSRYFDFDSIEFQGNGYIDLQTNFQEIFQADDLDGLTEDELNARWYNFISGKIEEHHRESTHDLVDSLFSGQSIHPYAVLDVYQLFDLGVVTSGSCFAFNTKDMVDIVQEYNLLNIENLVMPLDELARHPSIPSFGIPLTTFSLHNNTKTDIKTMLFNKYGEFIGEYYIQGQNFNTLVDFEDGVIMSVELSPTEEEFLDTAIAAA